MCQNIGFISYTLTLFYHSGETTSIWKTILNHLQQED